MTDAAIAPPATPDPLSLFRLDGQVAIVTGASSGLGERFARVLSSVGASVVVAARRLDRLEALAAELPDSLAVQADLSVAADREQLVASTLERFGRVDVLVNNAGIGTATRIEDETLEQFQFAMEVNVTAIWHLSKLCGESMVAAGSGSIVNVASMLGHVASTPIKQAHYCASKGAVINLTRELAAQWGRKGVRVNALSPGWFRSEMTGDMDTDESSQAFVTSNAMLPPDGERGRARRCAPAARESSGWVHDGAQPPRRRRLDRPLIRPLIRPMIRPPNPLIWSACDFQAPGRAEIRTRTGMSWDVTCSGPW